LQEDKPPVFDSLDQTSLALDVLAETLRGLRANEPACAAAVADPLLLATDLADYLVLKGVAFRNAHHIVGHLVKLSEEKNLPINELPLAEVREVSDALEDDWTSVFDLETAMERRSGPGMPGPNQVRREIARWKETLGR